MPSGNRKNLYSAEELRPLIAPRSVAVFGASDRPGFGRTVVESLSRCAHLGGRLIGINPSRPSMLDVEWAPTLADVENPPELAVVGVRADRVPDILRQCVETGIGMALVHSSGFGEVATDQAHDLAAEVQTIIDGSDLKVCGPNSLGLWNFTIDLSLGGHVTGAGSGPIGVVSQSGSLGMYTGQVAPQYGVATSHLLFPGNSQDIDALDLINYMLHDDSTRAVIAILEQMPDRDRVVELGHNSHELGKPVIAHKLGRTDRGLKAAASHTGSLAGSHSVAKAVLESSGIVVLDEFEGLMETAAFFSTARSRRSRRVGVVSAMGGVVVMSCDVAEAEGCELPAVAPKTKERLQEVVPSFGVIDNPVDITAAAGVVERQTTVLRILAEDPSIDTVMIPLAPAVGSPERPGEIAKVARDIEKNVCIYWMTQWHEGPGSEILAAEPGVAVFRNLRRTFHALELWERWWGHEPRTGPHEMPPLPLVSELGGPELFDGEIGALDALEALGVTVINRRVCSSESEVVAAGAEHGYPVVLKGAAPDLFHKSEHDLVALGIEDEDSLVAAYRSMRESLSAHYSSDGFKFIVAEQMSDGEEMFVGAANDDVAGPTVSFGLGGIDVGLRSEIVTLAAPVYQQDALRAIEQMDRAYKLLGYRGRQPRDVTALAELIERLSLVVSQRPDIAEVDINPAFVLDDGHGLVVADALFVQRDGPTESEQSQGST